jgi:hypothetical protein
LHFTIEKTWDQEYQRMSFLFTIEKRGSVGDPAQGGAQTQRSPSIMRQEADYRLAFSQVPTSHFDHRSRQRFNQISPSLRTTIHEGVQESRLPYRANTIMMLPWQSPNEKSALLPSNASGSGSSYYFLKGEPTEGQTNAVRDADGGEVIDIVPHGASEEDFASRPVVGHRVSKSTGRDFRWLFLCCFTL